MTIREMINAGSINPRLKALLCEEYEKIKKTYPNSWDRKFVKSMITYREKLSPSQIEQLERVLQDKIIEEEYPDGIVDAILPIITKGANVD